MAVTHLLTGSYASAQEPGIKLWEFDLKEGTLTEKNGISGIDRASFLAVHPNGKNFVATSEVGEGELVSFHLDLPDKRLAEVNRQSSGGDHPAHVCIDASGKWVLSVNYSGGNVNVYPFLEDGSIGGQTDSVRHKGEGPNEERQDAPHPHSVFQLLDNNHFLVSDLGTDMIFVYELNPANGKLATKQIVPTTPGSGPRHLAFHPAKPFIYSLEELSSAISVYEIGGEDFLKFVQVAGLTPEEFNGENTSAEVAVSEDGRFLYASNRGHDSIAVFKILEDGSLEFQAHVPSGGKGPRHFTLVPGGEWLVVANEKSDSLCVMKIGETGIPEMAGEPVHTPSPVCVKVIG
ncbi:6-phosphogluconolactonase [Planococcus glaciei]|uniref:lactonase family protein n=1 Tax=Planococcus glaciei TaxID=459472 RepID=UPI00088E3ABE|nr:lactonase family protein [Planococcus glaciei]SDG96743.1 6-phosphogluconolactonase [Planococcus glaciei]